MSPLPGGFANISGRSSIEITFDLSAITSYSIFFSSSFFSSAIFFNSVKPLLLNTPTVPELAN